MEPTLLLESYLKALRLPAFVQQYRRIAEDVALDHPGFPPATSSVASQEADSSNECCTFVASARRTSFTVATLLQLSERYSQAGIFRVQSSKSCCKAREDEVDSASGATRLLPALIIDRLLGTGFVTGDGC